MRNMPEIEEQEQEGDEREESVRQKATERREGEKRREEGGCRGAAEQEKTSAPWERSDGLSETPLCSHCRSDAQN